MARIIPNENTWVAFSASIASKHGPTAAEITASIDLTHYLVSINASSTGNAVPTPAFDTLFETTILGTSTATFTADFYRESGMTTGGTPVSLDKAWNLLSRSTRGFFLITRYDGKPTAGDLLEVWPVTVLSRAMANMTNNSVEMFTISCAVPDEPDEAAIVAA